MQDNIINGEEVNTEKNSLVDKLTLNDQENLDENDKSRLPSDRIMRKIFDVTHNLSTTLDLSNHNLIAIPEEILELSHLQNLYLNGNRLSTLPSNFFDKLPNLQWLDLRFNELKSIPSTYIGRHKFLRNLLLEGNNLRTLPLELGLINTMNGLNLRDNPLEFPPAEVIEKGTKEILKFFKEILYAKSGRKDPSEGSKDSINNNRKTSISSENDSTSEQLQQRMHDDRQLSSGKTRNRSTSIENEEFVGPVPKPVDLQRKGSSKKSLRSGGSRSGKSKSRQSKRIDISERIEDAEYKDSDKRLQKLMEHERRLALMRGMNEETDRILQKRRDAEKLQEFRDESRRRQMQKEKEKFSKGLFYKKAVDNAPFATDQSKLLTDTKKHADRLKAETDITLRIEEHLKRIHERRSKPKQSAQEELMAAQKELEIIQQLRGDLRNTSQFRPYFPHS